MGWLGHVGAGRLLEAVGWGPSAYMGPALTPGAGAPQAEILNKWNRPTLQGCPDNGDHSEAMKQGTWVSTQGVDWGQGKAPEGLTPALAPAEVEGVGWVASGVLGWWGADRGLLERLRSGWGGMGRKTVGCLGSWEEIQI